MIINIHVIARAKRVLIKKEDSGWKVYLTKPAVDGQANAQLVDLLAGHFKVKKHQIGIVHGAKSRNKLIRIDS